MPTSESIHVGSVGTEVVLQVRKDDGSVLVLPNDVDASMTFQRPDRRTFEVVAELDTDGSDGAIKYTTVEGDIDQAGVWRVQGFVSYGGGSWPTDVASFTVKPNL